MNYFFCIFEIVQNLKYMPRLVTDLHPSLCICKSKREEDGISWEGKPALLILITYRIVQKQYSKKQKKVRNTTFIQPPLLPKGSGIVLSYPLLIVCKYGKRAQVTVVYL